MKKLEGQELYRRLQEARNAKRLLEAQKQRNQALKQIMKQQAELIREIRKENALKKELIEKQALRIEYLEKIVFGKSKKKKSSDSDDENQNGGSSSGKKKDRKKRDPKTYQREIPKDSEITDTKQYPLSDCPDCGNPLTDKKMIERYREDIVLGAEQKNLLKEVEKQLIETGWCNDCYAQKSGHRINGSKVYFGENTRIMVVYLSVVMRLTHDQIRNMFRDIWHVKLSDGEVKNILREQSHRLTKAKTDIAEALLKQIAHYDETTWKTLKDAQGNYCWIKTGAQTTDTLFLFGKSRGKGNAETLCGGSKYPAVSDDYPGYDSVFESQALCWAHPNRKLRDLSESQAIQGKAKEAVLKTYRFFSKMYKELRGIMATDRPFEEKQLCKEKYWKRFSRIAKEKKDDPEQLKIYKSTLREEQAKYFLFLETEGIPMDNNQAERRLRHVVLKRKVSLGSKTAKGADILENLYSVVLTWWWRDPANFISNYRHLLA